MNTYTYTAHGPSVWGTHPHFKVTDLSALDLLHYIVQDYGRAEQTLHDHRGNAVPVENIFAESHRQADTAEARGYWGHLMAKAVVKRVDGENRDGINTTMEEDWIDAGRWWAQCVKVPPTAHLLAHLADQVRDVDDQPLLQAVFIFTESAITPTLEQADRPFVAEAN